MKRKDFLYLSGLGLGGAMLSKIPVLGASIAPGMSRAHPGLVGLRDADAAIKKQLADIALNAARAKGATYTDVRIGRYLNQFIVTREDKVENVVDTESFGMGIRVI